MAMTGNHRISHFAEPGSELRAVTPGDSTDLALTTAPAGGGLVVEKRYPRAIWVGGGGNLALTAVDDSAAVTLVGVAAGTIVPVRTKYVMSTNTTATSIVAIY